MNNYLVRRLTILFLSTLFLTTLPLTAQALTKKALDKRHTINKDGVIYKTASGINFVNGGVGEEEGADISRSAKHFSLQLLLTAGESGGWIPDASVLIIDENGMAIFTKKKAGPRLYIDLPAGKYQIIGQHLNVKQSTIITLIGDKPQRVILNWKDETGDDETNH